jgi:malonate decarboxylase beta subunit
LGLSGPEVIETAHGVEEFDSSDRSLVWRTTGGKHRFILGDAQNLVRDDIADFRQATLEALEKLRQQSSAEIGLRLQELESEQALLSQRLKSFGKLHEPREIWHKMGIDQPEKIALMEADEVKDWLRKLRTP